MAYSTNNLTAAHALHNNQDDTQTQNNPKTNAKSQQLLQKLLTVTEPTKHISTKASFSCSLYQSFRKPSEPILLQPTWGKVYPKKLHLSTGKI